MARPVHQLHGVLATVTTISTCFFAPVLMQAPMCAWMIESFPVAVRYSAVAIGYNGAHALIGGTILLVATALAETHLLVRRCGCWAAVVLCK